MMQDNDALWTDTLNSLGQIKARMLSMDMTKTETADFVGSILDVAVKLCEELKRRDAVEASKNMDVYQPIDTGAIGAPPKSD